MHGTRPEANQILAMAADPCFLAVGLAAGLHPDRQRPAFGIAAAGGSSADCSCRLKPFLADRRSLNIAHYRRFSAGSRNRCCFGGFDRSHPTDVASAPAGYCCDSRNADRILYYFGFGLDDKGPGGHLHCAVDGGAHCLG